MKYVLAIVVGIFLIGSLNTEGTQVQQQEDFGVTAPIDINGVN